MPAVIGNVASRAASPRGQGCGPEEWKSRVELAALYRIFASLGWDELIYTHSSLRVPGSDDTFLINPYGKRFDEITASSLVKVDVNGNVLGEGDGAANYAGFIIHGALHMGSHEAQCVIHTHTTAGMAVAAQKKGLLPITMYAHFFYDRIGYHEFEGPSLDADERPRIVRSLGSHKALIMRNHGLMAVGRSVAEAFAIMYRLQRAWKYRSRRSRVVQSCRFRATRSAPTPPRSRTNF